MCRAVFFPPHNGSQHQIEKLKIEKRSQLKSTVLIFMVTRNLVRDFGFS